MPTATQSVTFLTIDSLLQMIENKDEFTLVDVLAPDAYAEGHLPQAINIPSDKIEEEAPKKLIDKNAVIVVYCASYMCHASTEAARKLQALGYTHVLDFKGGKKVWQANAMPMATVTQ